MEDFEAIYREYFRDVELYLLALCREEGLAAELCSQVFFTALQQYPKFRGGVPYQDLAVCNRSESVSFPSPKDGEGAAVGGKPDRRSRER